MLKHRPTFEHRHYKVIASVLASTRLAAYKSKAKIERLDTIVELEDKLINYFRNDNEKFDAIRFKKAACEAPDMHGKDK